MFFPKDHYVFRGLDTQAHLLAPDAQDQDADTISDHQALADLAGKNQQTALLRSPVLALKAWGAAINHRCLWRNNE
jgi:hypothetical protein